jgi:hypothetical protein
MDTKAAIIALMSVWGVGVASCLPAVAEEPAIENEGDTDNPLLNKVWVQQGDSASPGTMQIFLADGTLVSDSCWEEDGMTINADISSLTADELVLSLKLGNDVVEQRFAPAEVPTVCPDMPR